MLEAVYSWADKSREFSRVRLYHVNELFNAISQKLSPERRFPKSGGGVFATTQLETDKYTFCQGNIMQKSKVKQKEIYKKYRLVEKLFSILYLGMACNWHDYDERPQFCSLQKIKSWAYVLSNHCCEEFNIELISQRHKPIDTMEEKAVI